jgi:hypothetical protein
MSLRAPPNFRIGRHRAALRALRAIIPRKYFVARTGSQKLAAAALSYISFLQSKGSATISLTQLERIQASEVMEGTKISAAAWEEQEALAFEAAKRSIVKLKQIRRKFKNMDKTERGENEIRKSEKDLAHAGDSDQSILHVAVVHNQAYKSSATETEGDDSENKESEEMDNQQAENEEYDEGIEEESVADSNATDQSSGNADRCHGSPDPEISHPLYQMGCRELSSGENAIAIGLGPNKTSREIKLRAVCTQLLALRQREVHPTILQPESFLAVKFDNQEAKDYALGFLRQTVSKVDFKDTTDGHEASDAESTAGSNEAVHDGHRGRRADGNLNYGNLHVKEDNLASTGEIQQALKKLADVATTLRELENENVALRKMLTAHGMDSEKITECLELIRAGGDAELAIFAVD